MTKLKIGLAFAVLALTAFGAAGAPAPFLKPNSAGLIGEWRQVAAEFEGVDQWPGEGPTLNRWLITGDTISIITRGKVSRGSWRYRLQPGNTPAGIDLNPDGSQAYPCVYKLEGNRLILCLQNYPARGRPKDLVSRKGSGVGRFVYERMAPGEYERQKE